MAERTPATRSRPKPIAVLDVVEVTRAVEEYLAVRHPHIANRVRSHGIRMTENGYFVWELHDEAIHGIEVVEATLLQAI